MHLLSNISSVILLYHSVDGSLKEEQKRNLHNIQPDLFYRQIKWLKEHFDIISIDDWFCLEDVRGKACITFDDAYLSIFKNALPFLISENIPSTVFLNPSFLSGESFWRDKVRYLIINDLVEEFLDSCGKSVRIEPRKFYGQSKKSTINSRMFHDKINDFLAEKRLIDCEKGLIGYLAQKNDLVENALVSYGNHTNKHYVLSSLADKEQEEEIIIGKKFIEAHMKNKSKVFAIPFGGVNTVNSHTFSILQENHYKYVLYSGTSLNITNKKMKNGLRVAGRFMVPPVDFYKKNIFKIYLSNKARSLFKIRSLIK